MSGLTFTRATKGAARARVALIGPAGCGKTWTALTLAQGLGGPVAVIDTEHGSASKYSDVFEFDVLELTSFAPARYVEAIEAAAAAGYGVLVIDSLSHAWMGKDGALEQVDRAAKRSQSGSTFGAWRDVTPQHNALVEAILAAPLHLVATMRSKTEYVQERDERTGKTQVRKVGMAPVMRDGVEYEFDVTADMDLEHNLIISKTRCPQLDGVVVNRPGAKVSATLLAWLTGSTAATAPVVSAPAGQPANEHDQPLARANVAAGNGATEGTPSPAPAAAPSDGTGEPLQVVETPAPAKIVRWYHQCRKPEHVDRVDERVPMALRALPEVMAARALAVRTAKGGRTREVTA